MEDSLDLVAGGKQGWVPLLEGFYGPYASALERARETMPSIEIESVPTGEACPECGAPLVYKHGRYGKFVGCSAFPECRYSAPLLVKTGAKCPQCGGDLVEKRTRRGRRFFGCSNYSGDDPGSCDFAVWRRPLPEPCPQCGGLLTEARRGWAKCTSCDHEVELEAPGANGTNPSAQK
jgi:DNA topoisomerase-1